MNKVRPIRQIGDAIVVETGPTQLVLDTEYGVPEICHIGRPLIDEAVADLRTIRGRPINRAVLDTEAPALICPEAGSGWQGRPGLRGRRSDRSAWSPRFSPSSIEVTEQSVRVVAADSNAGLSLATVVVAQPESIRIRLVLENLDVTDYLLDELLIGVPVPQRYRELGHLVGAWSHEFQMRRRPFSVGAHGFDNRRGRTSHDRVPALWAGTEGFGENEGELCALVLGWSGNAVVAAEYLTDGRRFCQLGEALISGDVRLGHGERYETPWLEIAWSDRGLNGTSQALHRSIRTGPVHPSTARPVTLNTWEAVYFDHDLATLSALADRFAALGGERFVLDDGWFHLRRDDTAGLGDWWVDPAVWPDGLEPLVDHVTGLGLQFGIWFEPEMVNPDSDLYRAHPEWALHVAGYELVLGRHQLVLNLGLEEVRDYLFEHVDAILSSLDISYVKWDMNRDLVQAGDGSTPALHDHQLGVYELIDRIRRAHPDVEIESCASGGGRADFEILKRTERIWTSDSNDPLERQRIQRGFSLLFPPEVMGAHIGPPRSHTSGRRHSLGFRAATAFFGHLGIEWNLLTLTDDEVDALANVISLHKQHRQVLHTGTHWRLDSPDSGALAHMVVANDKTEALLSFCQFDLPDGLGSSRIVLPGLDPDRRYGLDLVELAPIETLATRQTPWLAGGASSLGSTLGTAGLQMPLLNPESAVVVYLNGQ